MNAAATDLRSTILAAASSVAGVTFAEVMASVPGVTMQEVRWTIDMLALDGRLTRRHRDGNSRKPIVYAAA